MVATRSIGKGALNREAPALFEVPTDQSIRLEQERTDSRSLPINPTGSLLMNLPLYGAQYRCRL